MDVTVLIIVCHPGEKPKNGPNIAQTMITEAATKNTTELPANFAILLAKAANFFSICSNIEFPFKLDSFESRPPSNLLYLRSNTQQGSRLRHSNNFQDCSR